MLREGHGCGTILYTLQNCAETIATGIESECRSQHIDSESHGAPTREGRLEYQMGLVLPHGRQTLPNALMSPFDFPLLFQDYGT